MESLEECSRKIMIKELPDFFVLYERRIGNYRSLSGQWSDFLEKYRNYITNHTVFLERTFDDPSITDTDTCLYDICMSVDKNCTLENTCTIQGGTCAVYPFRGLAKHIYAAYQTIFNIWLPQSRYTLDNRCGFDIYRTIDCDSMYMELDICLPVKS
jgi:DNA gyrase inhibitor